MNMGDILSAPGGLRRAHEDLAHPRRAERGRQQVCAWRAGLWADAGSTPAAFAPAKTSGVGPEHEHQVEHVGRQQNGGRRRCRAPERVAAPCRRSIGGTLLGTTMATAVSSIIDA